LRPDELLSQASKLIDTNQMSSALLRITLSRGVGVRGYSTKGADRPTLVMATYPAAVSDTDLPRWRLHVSRFRVPAGEPLASFKTCNKLPQILARAEAERSGIDEALLLNTNGELAEAASSNLFWIEQENVCTTPLAAGILAGVMRDLVFELCTSLGSQVEEKHAKLETLHYAAGVFLTSSSLGIVEATELDGQTLATSNRVRQLRAAYLKALRTETR
jgi:branched-subunit amino acid aminotransferase/4-amino-4-deoxychorismate lyase